MKKIFFERLKKKSVTRFSNAQDISQCALCGDIFYWRHENISNIPHFSFKTYDRYRLIAKIFSKVNGGTRFPVFVKKTHEVRLM